MKTLRILTTWLMIIVSLSMTSCNNGDNEDEDGGSNSASIIGTWQSKEGDDFILTYKLDKNGSFTMTAKEYYQEKWETYTSHGEYEYEGDILTIHLDGDTYSYIVISVTSKTVKLKDDEGETITFSKI